MYDIIIFQHMIIMMGELYSYTQYASSSVITLMLMAMLQHVHLHKFSSIGASVPNQVYLARSGLRYQKKNPMYVLPFARQMQAASPSCRTPIMSNLIRRLYWEAMRALDTSIVCLYDT